MSNENKLIKKIKRREAYAGRSLSRFKDKIDKRDEIMARNPGMYNQFRGILRAIEKKTDNVVYPKNKVQKQIKVDHFDRHDFGGGDHGLRITMNIITAGVVEKFTVTTIAEPAQFEINVTTCPATSGAAQGDYFIFHAPSGDTYAVWLDLNADGTAPTGAAYLAATHQFKASIVTGNTNVQVRTAVLAALGSVPNMTITSTGTANITITSNIVGVLTDIASHNTGDTGAGSFSVTTSQQGVNSVLQNKYFLFSTDAGAYYAWMNVATSGVDPMVAGRTGIPIAISAAQTNAQVATAVAAAVNGTDGITATALSNVVTVTDAVKKSLTDATAGNSGFTVTVTQQGVTEVDSPILGQAGFQPNDLVEILTGVLKGHEYIVVSVIDPSTIRLQDDSKLVTPETNTQVKVKLRGNKRLFN